jgi:hypothetical protein
LSKEGKKKNEKEKGKKQIFEQFATRVENNFQLDIYVHIKDHEFSLHKLSLLASRTPVIHFVFPYLKLSCMRYTLFIGFFLLT